MADIVSEIVSPSSDDLGAVLSTLRVTGAVLSLAHLEEPFAVTSGTPPWGVFHAVLSGNAWAATPTREQPIRLVRGRVALFPSGAEHVISSDPQPSAPLTPVSASGDGPLPTMRIETGGQATKILCGTISFNDSPVLSVADALPDIVVTDKDTSIGWVHSTVELIAQELERALPAAEVVASRLTDVLVVRALREMVADGLGDAWAAGLRDPQLARALAVIHGDPAHPWSVADLAHHASMSRSSFYERFTGVVGAPPGDYMARWRIHVACGLLRDTASPVATVARTVGFRTDAGFSTAFKRWVGEPPIAYRRKAQARD